MIYELKSHSGIIFTGKNQGTRRQTWLSGNLSTTNPTWSDLVSKSGLYDEWPATKRVNHGTALV
jgi:hypothetical protein